MDATTSRESFYVAVSRAKYQLSLYTAARAELLRRAQRSSAKENVSGHFNWGVSQFCSPHPKSLSQSGRGTLTPAPLLPFWE